MVMHGEMTTYGEMMGGARGNRAPQWGTGAPGGICVSFAIKLVPVTKLFELPM